MESLHSETKVKRHKFNDFTALHLYKIISRFLQDNPCMNIALSGGSTPLPILEKLKTYSLDWERLNFYIVDERTVSKLDSNSNYGNLFRSFFSFIKSKSYQIYFPEIGAKKSAKKYETLLYNSLYLKNNKPQFDLIILGMGEDGHTASLFPNTEALLETNKMIVSNYVDKLKSTRITFTYPLIINSKAIIVLIKGEKKISVLDRVKTLKTELPIRKIAEQNNVEFILGYD